jgi:gluconolactonase
MSHLPKFAPLFAVFLFAMCRAGAVSFEIDDPVEFAKIINTNNPHVTNATVTVGPGGISGNPVEAPVWIPAGGFLVFSDLVNNKLRKIVLPNTVTDFLTPPASTLCNGDLLDAQERQFTCEAGTAGLRVVMITNGVVTPIVSTCNGLKFYSPNDLCFKSDGTLWFTDPGYNGVTAPPPQTGFAAGYYVYRCDPANGNASCTTVITSGVSRPNGLCFSPDESKLYLADSGPAHHILVYTVTSSNTLSGGATFATIGNGVPDGIRCDVDGRVWSSSGEGVYIYAPDGHLIGKIKYGLVSNLCFGGTRYHTLFMAGYPYVTSIDVLVTGMPSYKKLAQTFDGNQLSLTWPAPSTGFTLQESDQLDPAANWTNSTLTPIVTNAQNLVTVPPTNSSRFYRLRLN